ncbi:hypothetical protein A3E46_00885 [Candidatus Woesebacteria bacterium RIFCSPHIGHO2_12_FULL_46_16]|uniref:Glycosyltransferase 2-like domain-containing protein n=1 Tax=Candidatus Woesebacteria bacterium RIFCSPHIGHO2_12_FULL_46_16 TaxID=1802513 RepID=A0A1F8AZU2_9BACT|nr:MAG: hypothetical protein A3E46_00885 [Candidatus Woesebacteria bacterium RIFCSPHIGHO2_12_FULL_46_16]
MKISVIIPTFNEEEVMGECLKSLVGQKDKDFEVIVVDDGSTDGTLDIIKRFDVGGLELMVLKQNHKGPAAARNLGAEKSRGEILVFVDADMTFDKNFLKNLVKPILGGKVQGTFSKYEYVSNWDNVWARCWNINQNWEKGRRHPKNYPDKQKVFRAITKKEFDRVGGFTPGGYTDDYSLFEKLGYMAVSAPGAIFYHENPSGLTEVFRQAKWSGKRKYKFGPLGYIIALIRASFPISVILGLIKAFINGESRFLLFKIVYDFGIFVGILEQLFLGKQTK